MKRKPLIITGVIVAALLLIVIILPMVIDVNKFKPTMQTDITSALGRKIEIGNIKLAIFSGGVSIDDVSIADDPAFSRSPFLTAKHLTVGVELLPLIFSKKLEVRSFTVAEPEVSLVRNSSGTWNFSSLGGDNSKSKPKGNDSPSTAEFSVEKLEISNGKIILGTAGSSAKPQVYEGLNLKASDLSYTTQFPFTLTAKLPGSGTLKLEGKAGPINTTDASLTPLDAKIEVEHLDLALTGFVNPSAGIAGLIDFNGSVASDGQKANSKGTVKAQKVKMVANGSPATVPVNVDYTTVYDLKRQSGVINQGDVHIGKALARLTGTFETAGQQPSLQMKMNGQGMAVPDLEGVLPAVGVKLPPGASFQSGSLDLNLAISGPVDKLVITGPLNLSNAKLVGFSMGSKLGALSSFAGLGGKSGGSDTEIQTLSTNVRVDPSGTRAQNLNVVVPSIGTVTGDGNVSASGQLDFKMVAKLSSGGSPVGAVTTGLGALGGSKSQGGGIPFRIEGTTSNPIFIPDVAGMAGNALKNGAAVPTGAAGAATGAIGGLFGKKKSQ
jgi:AsmA protein